MSAPEVETAAAKVKVQRYGRIVIVGGGCYGCDYVRQLSRARRAGAIDWQTLSVVDHNRSCAVTDTEEFASSGAELVVAEWSQFFDEYLSEGSVRPESISADGIVPSPLMPHLMYQWLVLRAQHRWPNWHVATRNFDGSVRTPWEQLAPDGTRYASFATWICPVHCIEPKTCPHTKGPRDWSFPTALQSFVEASTDQALPLKGPVIFHCVHRVYGVGMFDTAAVIAGDRMVAEAGAGGTADVLVGTVSHCHAALNILSVRESGDDSTTDLRRNDVALVGP